MKIEINLKIVLLLLLFFVLNKMDVYVIFIVFVLIHECMHMIAGISVGFIPEVLKLNPLGVSIEFYNYGESSQKNSYKRIFTYLLGPISNFVIAIVCYFLKMDDLLKMKLIYTNILIGSFNLIPILPLDGGKIFKEFLKIFFGHKNAHYFMLISTKVILVMVTFVYSIAIFKMKNIAIFLLILYLWYLYYLEDRKYKVMARMYDVIDTMRM